ncbi:MAG: CpsD/CapB family tyrosine-protein kinase [Firmicutes bacterium]|nr:CpsD/CapB family tyrosine-protein kinase [Bacillota bacterium]
MQNLEIYNEKNSAVLDAYERLMAYIHFASEKEQIRSLSVCSCRPGVGKTTTAINLAIAMAYSGKKTLLVDADTRKPGSFKRLYMDTMPGFTDIIEDGIRLQDAVNSSNIRNLFYLSCGKKSKNPIELLCSSEFDKFNEEVKEKYEFVVFDTPSLTTVIDGTLVAAKTDAVILIAQIGLTNLDSLNRAVEQLENANAKLIGVVLNRVKKRDYKKYVESYNYFKRFDKEIKKKGLE